METMAKKNNDSGGDGSNSSSSSSCRDGSSHSGSGCDGDLSHQPHGYQIILKNVAQLNLLAEDSLIQIIPLFKLKIFLMLLKFSYLF